MSESGYMMGFGWIGILLVIVVVIYLLSGNTQNKSDKPSARDILDKRYVNGEIDEEEYKRMRGNLR